MSNDEVGETLVDKMVDYVLVNCVTVDFDNICSEP